jgi:hypothetical protein
MKTPGWEPTPAWPINLGPPRLIVAHHHETASLMVVLSPSAPTGKERNRVHPAVGIIRQCRLSLIFAVEITEFITGKPASSRVQRGQSRPFQGLPSASGSVRLGDHPKVGAMRPFEPHHEPYACLGTSAGKPTSIPLAMLRAHLKRGKNGCKMGA